MTPDADIDIIYSLAAARCKGLYVGSAALLLEKVGSWHDFFAMPTQRLIELLPGGKYNDYDTRRQLLDDARREYDHCRDHHVSVVSHLSEAYPTLLAACDDAPLRLYACGSCDLNAPRRIAIVGTRRCTPWGANFTATLVRDLAAALDGKCTIISGLAYGTDITAHKAALDAGVPTVAVVAHGLDTIYPAEHRTAARAIVEYGGAIVSEYPWATRMHRSYFLARNRIIAGMADITIVVESDMRGGAMSTARCASAYSREVGAVPGRVSDPQSRGTNDLIARNIAAVVRDADDVLKLMNWRAVNAATTTARLQPQLFKIYTPEQQTIIDHLRQHPDHTINTMCAALDIPYATLSAILMEMEMDNMLIGVPGGRFIIK